MKVYILKESDFERLKLLMEKIEAESRAREPAGNTTEGDLRRTYRYHIFTWVNDVQADKA